MARMEVGWNVKKLGQFFSSFDALFWKNTKKILWLALPEKNSFDIFLIVLQEHFVYE